MAEESVESPLERKLKYTLFEIKDHGVAVLTWNRPKARNAWHTKAFAEINSILDWVEQAVDEVSVLITTGAGLMVAIPCYAAFNLLVVKIDRIVLDMERAASEIIAFLTGAVPFSEEAPNNHA